jgi:hypothetical protein
MMEPEPEPESSKEKEARLASGCPAFGAARRFVATFGLAGATFDPNSEICYKQAAVEILHSEWQLLNPGELTPSGYEMPIRGGHIKKPFERVNAFTQQRETFDPQQVFTSPSIHYCAYGGVYCDRTAFEGRWYQVRPDSRGRIRIV